MKNNSGIACNPQIKTLTKYLEPKHVVLSWKKILLVKVIWGDASGEDATWELESQMREAHPSLFESGKFRGRNF